MPDISNCQSLCLHLSHAHPASFLKALATLVSKSFLPFIFEIKPIKSCVKSTNDLHAEIPKVPSQYFCNWPSSEACDKEGLSCEWHSSQFVSENLHSFASILWLLLLGLQYLEVEPKGSDMFFFPIFIHSFGDFIHSRVCICHIHACNSKIYIPGCLMRITGWRI